MGGGGSKPKAAAKPMAAVSYRQEAPRQVIGGEGQKRTIGAQYMASRKKTKQGAGFGGQSQTLG
jgi:hypothetical protein